MASCLRFSVLLLLLLSILAKLETGFASTWAEWWTYEGISGPDFWGLVNPEWYLCSQGRRQSPINIDPNKLLFDPELRDVRVDRNMMGGMLVNTGHDVRLILDEPSVQHMCVNISGGPLAYNYTLSEVILRFGLTDSTGSEHTVNGYTFPAEVQLMGYNSDLYSNMSQALQSTYGLAIIAVLVQIGNSSNSEFDIIAQNLKSVRYKGQQVRIRHISVHSLLPMTDNYMTYDGSLTYPGCFESVTWIVLNKPLYLSNEHLSALREIMQGEVIYPKYSMADNYRPIMATNHRTIRTNINSVNPTNSSTTEQHSFTLGKEISLHLVPDQEFTLVGSKVEFSCITYDTAIKVEWKRIPVSCQLPVDLTFRNVLLQPYKSRMRIEEDEEIRGHLLIIENVEFSDSGTYRCVLQSDSTTYIDSELIVIAPPQCHGNDISACQTGHVSMSCGVYFLGNIPPVIRWIDSSGKIIINRETKTNNPGRVTSTLATYVQFLSQSSVYTCKVEESKASCNITLSDNCPNEQTTIKAQTTRPRPTYAKTPKMIECSSGSQFHYLALLLLTPMVAIYCL